MATIIPAQVPPKLPNPVPRPRRGAPARESFTVEIETVTPILGGAPEPRTIDEIDVIRVPTIRGHLRFWWRALYGQNFASPAELFAAEAQLWGKAADDKGGRSAVEIAVGRVVSSEIDKNEPAINSPAGYALFPARSSGDGKTPTAPRRRPGVRFPMSITAPGQQIDQVKNAVRAWTLFGGYGSRTRRGLGSLTISGEDDQQREWLPHLDRPDNLIGRSQLRQRLTVGFGADIFQPGQPTRSPSFPTLAGATLVVGTFSETAPDAWTQALKWLHDFRQREGIARNGGTAPNRPGRSRWPEPDKLRHVFDMHSQSHPPRYDASPNWPRAQFGLPILGQFSGATGPGEPPNFELTWELTDGKPRDRMASPLIVKPLPIVGGFFPCALWLARGYPPGRVVVLRQGNREAGAVGGSAAGFGDGLSLGDQQLAKELGSPWDGPASIRNTFLTAVVNGRLDPQGRRGFRVAP